MARLVVTPRQAEGVAAWSGIEDQGPGTRPPCPGIWQGSLVAVVPVSVGQKKGFERKEVPAYMIAMRRC